MVNKLVHASQIFICIVLVVQLTGCGTLMYPERKGQKSGKIDAGVAVLDGIGLLLFIIPGIIAFAIDFNNGTIYLPGTSRASVDLENIKEVKFDPKHSTMAGIERMIQEQTGHSIKFDQPNMEIVKLKSIDDMKVQFAQAVPEVRDNRIAFNR